MAIEFYYVYFFSFSFVQVGQHMQDSILSSYTALLLGILAEHNNVCVVCTHVCAYADLSTLKILE